MNFEQLLKQRMGLDLASVGADTVERAVNARMTAVGLASREDYWDQLQSSAEEFQELVETVVVPETSFFRDQEAFEAFSRSMVEEWLPTHPGKTLNVLSAPCSTGEEPYSMAMALAHRGFPRERLHIDAIDISLRALNRAERGIYGTNSFRGQDFWYRDLYFDKAPQGWQLSEVIRRSVNFHHVNLLTAAFHFAGKTYDCIFCRNLLIYFDRATQEDVLGSLGKLLAADGLLFVGPAEAFLATLSGFKSIAHSLSFAFRKATATAPKLWDGRPARLEPTVASKLKPPASPRVAKKALAPIPQPLPLKASEQTLEDVQRLADSGRLAEAADACATYLAQNDQSAEGHYLLGVIRGAKCDFAGAEQSYRKVLYLDPQHAEAMTHLALLLDKKGDRAGADRLRTRTLRLRPGWGPAPRQV